jgi:hypothetical protein
MPVFPADDVASDDKRWLFFQIDRDNRGVVIGVKECCASDSEDFKRDDLPWSKKTARVRDVFFGGGRYENTHLALLELSKVLEASWFFGPLVNPIEVVHGDVFIANDVSYHTEAPVPFQMAAEKLAKHMIVEVAVDAVFDAMRADAEAALKAWREYPNNLKFRQKAMDEIKAFRAAGSGRMVQFSLPLEP